MIERLFRPSAALHEKPSLGRRGFLRTTAGVLVAGAAGCTAAGGIEPGAGPGAAGAGGKADGVELDDSGRCLNDPTGRDALGPYWTPNVVRTNVLAGPDAVGQRLVIEGHVLGRDCITPLVAVPVVAWQADDTGRYDYNHAGLNQGMSERVITADETRLRGLFTSGEDGAYRIETIFPREYPLNLLDPEDSAYRAPHIHFVVFYRDERGTQRNLVTQLYFRPNDLVRGKVENIEVLNALDGGASVAEPARFATLTPGTADVWQGRFDLVVDVDPTAIPT